MALPSPFCGLFARSDLRRPLFSFFLSLSRMRLFFRTNCSRVLKGEGEGERERYIKGERERKRERKEGREGGGERER